MEKMPSRAWAEINLDNIAHNFMEIRKYLNREVQINGVIKADGYGHGAVMTAKILCENGVDMLSLATLDEAVQLRKQKITVPLLVLGYTDVGRLREIIRNDITVSIFDIDIARKLSAEAENKGKKINVHLKIDTGMNRIGFHYSEEETIFEAYNLKGLNICGTFTHFSTADEKNKEYTNVQYERFMKILNELKKRGVNPGMRHANNSGGTILHREKSLDMVRTGLLLYGLYPSEETKRNSQLELKSSMVLKAKIIKVKQLKKGLPVSYGNKYITDKSTKIATIACGYADGYSRVLSGKARVIINGKQVPLVGNICMDMCMADISSIETPVCPGDEAVLFNGEIKAGDIALIGGTTNYEIICRIGMRIPRVYIKRGTIIKVNNYLL